MNIRDRWEKAGIDPEEVAALLWPLLERKIRRAELRDLLLCAAISGLTSAWSYEDRRQETSASQVAQTAKRIVAAVMRELEE